LTAASNLQLPNLTTRATIGILPSDAPVQCDCCRQRFMDTKSLALHKKFIYDPNRADSKLEE
jgi:hypothetical protein